MGVRNQNSTSYVHPDEPNLLNLHKAMVYRDDEPHLRVTLGQDNITITGNVNLVDQVRINNTESQMIPVYLVGNVLTVNQGTTPWYANANVIGNISGITTLPAIRGNVNIDNFPSKQISIPPLIGHLTKMFLLDGINNMSLCSIFSTFIVGISYNINRVLSI
jgi:hypothetical protein